MKEFFMKEFFTKMFPTKSDEEIKQLVDATLATRNRLAKEFQDSRSNEIENECDHEVELTLKLSIKAIPDDTTLGGVFLREANYHVSKGHPDAITLENLELLLDVIKRDVFDCKQNDVNIPVGES